MNPVAGELADTIAATFNLDSFDFDFSPLMASDLSGRARSFGQLVKGGMDVEKAAQTDKPVGACGRMTTRRAEIPSLNASITRKIRYVTGADSFGSMRTTTLSRVTRARLLEASPTDRLRIANPQFQDKALRRYLVRPDREMS